jgi:hypothetical protein
MVPYSELKTLEESFTSNNTLTLESRDFPAPGNGNWGQWYKDLKAAKGTITIDNEAGYGLSNSAVATINFRGSDKQAIVVENLKGCIAVLCASHVGESNHTTSHFLRSYIPRRNDVATATAGAYILIASADFLVNRRFRHAHLGEPYDKERNASSERHLRRARVGISRVGSSYS